MGRAGCGRNIWASSNMLVMSGAVHTDIIALRKFVPSSKRKRVVQQPCEHRLTKSRTQHRARPAAVAAACVI